MSRSSESSWTSIVLNVRYLRILRQIKTTPSTPWAVISSQLHDIFGENCLLEYSSSSSDVNRVSDDESWMKWVAKAQREAFLAGITKFEGELEATAIPLSKIKEDNLSLHNQSLNDSVIISPTKPTTNENNNNNINNNSVVSFQQQQRREIQSRAQITFRCRDSWVSKDITVPAGISWPSFRAKINRIFGRPVAFSYVNKQKKDVTVATREEFSACLDFIFEEMFSSTMIALISVIVVPYVTTLSRWIPHLRPTQALGSMDVAHAKSSQLMTAVKEQDPHSLLQLRNEGVDLNERDWMGKSPLHVAAEGGKEISAKRLVELGAEKKIRDRLGRLPLHLSSSANVSNLLLQESVLDARAKDDMGQTPLHRVTNKEAARELIRSGNVNVNEKDKSGFSPLHASTMRNDADMCQFLLEEGRAAVDACDNFRRTPLHLASSAGSVSCALILLSNGASVTPVDIFGRTPLHYASLSGQKLICRHLIDRGADVSKLDYSGSSASSLAADAHTAQAFNAISSSSNNNNSNINNNSGFGGVRESGIMNTSGVINNRSSLMMRGSAGRF